MMTINDFVRVGVKSVALVLFLSGVPGEVGAAEAPLEPGDRIQLKLVGVPEKEMLLVSGLYTVGGDGTLNLPHLSHARVKAGGVTRTVLEQSVQKAYREAQIYSKPTVVINVDSAGQGTARVVTVFGEVRASGQVPFREKMTMLEAIAGTGGRSDFADMSRVMLIRDGKASNHDLREVSKRPEVDVELKPGDKVMVREKGFPRFLGGGR